MGYHVRDEFILNWGWYLRLDYMDYLNYFSEIKIRDEEEREFYEEMESWEAASEEDCRGLED